jgi:hypothetical protein
MSLQGFPGSFLSGTLSSYWASAVTRTCRASGKGRRNPSWALAKFLFSEKKVGFFFQKKRKKGKEEKGGKREKNEKKPMSIVDHFLQKKKHPKK